MEKTNCHFNPIFIGGTGRSGTTILAKILNNHSQIYSFPLELRFITDPDGLISLRNAIVQDWCFFHSDKAISRFIKLMKSLKQRVPGNYPNHFLGKVTGYHFYDEWLNDYLSDLVDFEFVNGWAGRVNIYQKLLIKAFGKKTFINHFLPTSYFSKELTEEQFLIITKQFVNMFYCRIKSLYNKLNIVDHTPYNILHAKFLLQLFPGGKIINISREINDVASSYSTKDWGHPDVKNNLLWLSNVNKKWSELKMQIPKSSFIEIKFEDLIFKKKETLESLCIFLGVEIEESFFEIDTSKHNIGRSKNA